MKLTKYISALGMSLLLFASCESDLETATYNSDTAKPAELSALKDAYTLNNKKADAEAIAFKWTHPELGFRNAAKSSLEMDVDGKDFANKVVLASSTTDSTYSITNNELNSKILGLLETYELGLEPVKIAFRLSTSISDAVAPLISNVVTTTITPYSGDVEYPKVWVIGDYCGWNFANSQYLFSFDNSTTYQGVVDFGEKAANGFKINGVGNWNDATQNWGTDGKTEPKAEAANITLWADGGSGNIQCYSKRFYHFTFDTQSAVLKNDFGFNVLGIIGDGANGWGDTDDIVMNFDPVKQRFYADATLKDGKIKFRADHAWDINYGDSGTAGILAAGAGDITVTAGNYRIYVNLNNPAKLTYELNAKDYGKE